jgi:hypothetical protein
MATFTQLQAHSRSKTKMEAVFGMHQRHINHGLPDGLQPIHLRVAIGHKQVSHIPACFLYFRYYKHKRNINQTMGYIRAEDNGKKVSLWKGQSNRDRKPGMNGRVS